ncbi:MAG: HipA domain-containing protein [Gammaproteobacteria bacterium]|nr:HipA domain-containing protein [Gammaproteobacteria bacterium]
MVLFVPLAGIDGHAKNFSIFIEADNRYRLTALYDIMSAHPMLVSGQLQSQKLKMAMRGQNRHYHWHSIHWRHFISSAKVAEKIMHEMLAQVDEVITRVSVILPESFPPQIAEAIFTGMRRQRDKLALGMK